MTPINSLPWDAIFSGLTSKGFSTLKGVLTANECKILISTYHDEQLFRKTINMARYRFGSGEYKYFDYPLPEIVQNLREKLYARLYALANQWMNDLQTGITYPAIHLRFLELCHEKSQNRPTPLILRYHQGDYNTLHQDLYGEMYFPIQAILFLSQPGTDYKGGELVLTEQVPRAQSKAIVLTPQKGDIVLLTTQFRPQKGTRGFYRVNMRHGVSEVTKGSRYTLGIIFHDAA